MHQNLFWAVVFGYDLGIFAVFVASIRQGHRVLAAVAALFASPVPMTFVTMGIEGRSLGAAFNVEYGSWSYTFGDTIALPLAAAFCAQAWRSIPREGWQASQGWSYTSLILGVAAGIGFHVMDSIKFASYNALAMMVSPSKIFHDFGPVVTLLGGFICVGLPILIAWWKRSLRARGFVLCLLVWVGLVVCDVNRDLAPAHLHIEWNSTTFQPL